MNEINPYRYLFPIARALLVGTFVLSAIKHLTHWGAALDEMSNLGMPRSGLLMAGSISLRLIGGLSVLTGYRARIGAALLLAFVLPATFLGHAFWAMPLEKQSHESVEFLNNLAMAGGVLFVLLAGPSPTPSNTITTSKIDHLQTIA
jgi:putative oxidoreductase